MSENVASRDGSPGENLLGSHALVQAGLHSVVEPGPLTSDPSPVAVETGNAVAKSLRGAGWTIGWRLTTRGIGMLSTLILVRLLSPSDFGLVTLAYGLISSMDGFIAFGTEGAIIRSEEATRDIYNAAFTINVVRALVTSVLLALAAAPLANFFEMPALSIVIYALAIGWAISGFQNVGLTAYRRDMNFEMEFRAKIIPRVLSLFVTIPIAAIWHSYWALVGGILSSQIISVVVTYMIHPFRPRFGVAGMKHVFAFSFWEWLISMTNLIGGRADTMIIGRVLDSAAIGIYGVGGEIAALPSGEIVMPLCRALFSGFAEEKRQGKQPTNSLLQMLGLLATFIFPMSIGLSLVAYPITRLCFGPEWVGAVPIIQLLSIAGCAGLIGAVGEALFSANAWLRTILVTSITTMVIRVTLLAVLIPAYGMLGGAMAATVMVVLQETVYIYIARKRLGLRFVDVLAAIARPAFASAIMAAVLWTLGLGWSSAGSTTNELLVDLILAVGLGALTYMTSLAAVWLAVGRPAGPEAALVGFAKRRISRV